MADLEIPDEAPVVIQHLVNDWCTCSATEGRCLAHEMLPDLAQVLARLVRAEKAAELDRLADEWEAERERLRRRYGDVRSMPANSYAIRLLRHRASELRGDGRG